MDDFGKPMDRPLERPFEPAPAPQQPPAPDRPFTRVCRNPGLVEQPADTSSAPEFVRSHSAAASAARKGDGDQPTSTPVEKNVADQSETPAPFADVASHLSATATTHEVVRLSDSEPKSSEGATSFSNGHDRPEQSSPEEEIDPEAWQNEGQETGEQPFTVVEFGSGRDPVITYDMAPDISHLNATGGRYTAVDANSYNLEHGQKLSRLLTEEDRQPGAEVTAEFIQGTIRPEAPFCQKL